MTRRSFSPIPLSSMQTYMGNPGFSALATNDLGSNGTASDGFDSLLAQAISDVNAGSSVLSGLNLLFSAMDYSADPVQSPQWSSAVSQFAGIESKADSMFSQTAQVLGQPAGTVTSPPIKAPVVSPIVTAPVHGGGAPAGSGAAGDEGPPTLGSTVAGQVGTNLGTLQPITHQPLSRL